MVYTTALMYKFAVKKIPKHIKSLYLRFILNYYNIIIR